MKIETMNSRERVIRTLNREPVDRMPIDLGSHFSTGISLFAYWELREYLGLGTDAIRSTATVPQLIADVDRDILERLHCDCMVLHPSWSKMRPWNPRGKYVFSMPAAMQFQAQDNGDWIVERDLDGVHERMRLPSGGFFFDGDWIDGFWDCDDEERLRRETARAEYIFKETPYATNYIGDYNAFFGDIDFQMRMMTDPDGILEENNALCDQHIASFAKAVDALGEYVQMVTICDDMGVQTGPACNPASIEQFTIPFIKRFTDFVHKNSDMKVFLHSCGAINPLIPMFIEAGVDILNPVQISAADMDPQNLKDTYGDDIIFWGGGVDTQHVLGTQPTKKVEENVEHLVKIFKRDGGYVFNPVHNIMGNVPPEDIVAMYDKAYENSFYENPNEINL